AGEFGYQVSAFTRYSAVKFLPDRAGDLIFNGVASSVRRSLVSNGFEFDGKWNASPLHTLRAGAVVTTTNAATHSTVAVFPTDADGDQASSTPFDIADDQHKVAWLYGVYVQDEWKPADALTVNFGLRADASRAYLNEGQVSPRLNLVYRVSDATSFHAGY